MEPLASKDKRASIRIGLLDEAVNISDIDGGRSTTCKIFDITAEGCFLITEDLRRPRDLIRLQFLLPGDLGHVETNGEVIRVAWHKSKTIINIGMGIRFVDVSENIKKILTAYTVFLRNKQIITVSKRIIDEFFGNR